jgi:ribosomal protein S18 acetylase RimI-like enzyme
MPLSPPMLPSSPRPPNRCATSGERYLVAFEASQAAGFACLRVTPAIGSRVSHALLTELYVRTPFRRHGIASALVQQAESLALQRGATDLFLFTGRQNTTAQAFYEQLGFESRFVTYQKPLG